MQSIPILIPAYQPEPVLLETISALRGLGFRRVVVVDDGSTGPSQDVLSQLPDTVHLLRHAINRGKGAALKTGLNYILLTWPEAPGAITADADGQHAPADIRAVARHFNEHPEALVLGSRRFDSDVPWRNRAGNRVSSWVLRLLAGARLDDTQTGLRAIPSALAQRILKIASNGYEFELDMLLEARAQRVPIREVPIRTIYVDGNRSSHFSPFRDSMRVGFVLVRFTMTSVITAALDNAVFILAYNACGNILASQAAGRAVAAAFQYSAVRRAVFQSDQRHVVALPKYLLLVLINASVSYGLITVLNESLGVEVVAAKIVVETVLFLVSFAIQRDFVFQRRRGES